MQSAKKFRKPKKERVDAAQFAAHYATSVGSYKDAIANAEKMAKDAYSYATKEGIPYTDAKEYIRTSNFWVNVTGVLKQQQVKMTGGTKAKV